MVLEQKLQKDKKGEGQSIPQTEEQNGPLTSQMDDDAKQETTQLLTIYKYSMSGIPSSVQTVGCVLLASMQITYMDATISRE